jgi:hypothetical protein
MFIHARAARLFRNRHTGETFLVRKEFVGEVPDWVTKTQLFRNACAAGTITALVGTSDAELLGKANTPEQAASVRKAAADKAAADAAYEKALAEAGITPSASSGDKPDPAPATGAPATSSQPKAPAKGKKPAANKPAKADSADD